MQMELREKKIDEEIFLEDDEDENAQLNKYLFFMVNSSH